ncbi:MAG: hypothetical protein M3094_02700 [Actinomycetia bacterium]|nr:hypothetical protein [Actinomycetes bacterium]
MIESSWPGGEVLVLNGETNIASWHSPAEVMTEQDEETRRLYLEEK